MPHLICHQCSPDQYMFAFPTAAVDSSSGT
jgi:hypothetical protein